MNNSIAKRIAESTGCRFKISLNHGKGYLSFFPKSADATQVNDKVYKALISAGARITQNNMAQFSPNDTNCFFYVRDVGNETITIING